MDGFCSQVYCRFFYHRALPVVARQIISCIPPGAHCVEMMASTGFVDLLEYPNPDFPGPYILASALVWPPWYPIDGSRCLCFHIYGSHIPRNAGYSSSIRATPPHSFDIDDRAGGFFLHRITHTNAPPMPCCERSPAVKTDGLTGLIAAVLIGD